MLAALKGRRTETAGLKAQAMSGLAPCTLAIYGREGEFVGATGWSPATPGTALSVPIRDDATSQTWLSAVCTMFAA